MFGQGGAVAKCVPVNCQSQVEGSNPQVCKISKSINLCNNKNIE